MIAKSGIEVYTCHISLLIRQGLFPSITIPRILDPSYRMDQDVWDFFKGEKHPISYLNVIRLKRVFQVMLGAEVP